MRIGIVSNLYPPYERGGAELVASRIADGLAVRGHKVSVLSTKAYEGMESFFPRLTACHLERIYRFAPFNIYGLEDGQSNGLGRKLIWHFLDLWAPFGRLIMHRWIVQEQLDVIITHNLKGIGLSISRDIQHEGVLHIHTLHDLQLTLPSGLLLWGKEQSWFNRSFLRRWYEHVVMWAMREPDIVISPSHFLLNAYQERGFFQKAKIVVLPNPIPKILASNRQERLSGSVRFLFAGQLEAHKGILFLLKVIEKLSVPFELHIVGDGALAKEINNQAELNSQVFFHGFISLQNLVHMLGTTDAVILPSLCYENSPTIIYESFAVGVPVIASNIGGIPELIQDSENGYLFEPGNADELIAAMERVAQNPEFWWTKSEVIKRSVERFSVAHYVDELLLLISSR